MNRAEIDIYIAQIEIEEARLRARLPSALTTPDRIKEAADETLKRTKKMLKHPGLEVLKQGVDNFARLPADQQSQITQLYTVWVANAQETLKTLQALSDAMA